MTRNKHTPETMTAEQFRGMKKGKVSKYRNKKCVYNGIKFDSKKEMNRYIELRYLEIKGNIQNLELQKEYGLQNCVYRADFVYKMNGLLIVEDVKGFRTAIYRLKKKMMKSIHGIEIREI